VLRWPNRESQTSRWRHKNTEPNKWSIHDSAIRDGKMKSPLIASNWFRLCQCARFNRRWVDHPLWCVAFIYAWHFDIDWSEEKLGWVGNQHLNKWLVTCWIKNRHSSGSSSESGVIINLKSCINIDTWESHVNGGCHLPPSINMNQISAAINYRRTRRKKVHWRNAVRLQLIANLFDDETDSSKRPTRSADAAG